MIRCRDVIAPILGWAETAAGLDVETEVTLIG